MPELPEVENTALFLKRHIAGHLITAVKVRWHRSVDRPKLDAFHEHLLNSKVHDVCRRGKYIVISITAKDGKSFFLLAHMRMSGHFEFNVAAVVPHKHDRIILGLSNGGTLHFNDPRKFGRFYLVESAEDFTAKLGPEPLAKEFTSSALYSMLKVKKGTIKPLLLNQSFIAGVGNIYADESLWHAKIHPLRHAHTLTKKEACALHKALRSVLKAAIARGGTDNGDGVVEYGNYRPRVYGRHGKSCKRCTEPIKRIVLGQRGTHFCPICQLKRKRRI